jgi:hypothetical protein
MTKRSVAKPETPKPALLVFGLDENGKPKGARFVASQFEPASQAALTMNLHICEALSDDLVELSKKLPSGRIYARGRAFVPFIKRDLYDKLHAASGGLVRDAAAAEPEKGTLADGNAAPAAKPADAQPVVKGLPRYWDQIQPGHLILNFEGPGEGWWEAVVVTRSDQMLTLRYRDFPKVAKFDRHISTVENLASPEQTPTQQEKEMTVPTERIRMLNDQLRKTLTGGSAIMTPGVAALGPDLVGRAIKTLATFDDFHHANDPFEEHDFGAFDLDGHKLSFKIDYYNKALTYHSPDPADPAVTERVITLMLANEY